MFARSRFTRVVAGLAVIGAATVAGVQIAAATGPGTHYTGCLSNSGGFTKFKAGDAPTAACGNNNTKIQLGDGSGVGAGAQLPANCTLGQIAAYSYAGWYCSPDMGGYVNKSGPVSATVYSPGPCPDGDVFTGYKDKQADNHTSKISLPTGTYRPGVWGDTHWSIDKITDEFGDNWSGGFVRIDVVRTRSGADSVVSSFVRVKSQNLDNSLPYERDFTPFTAFGSDQYFVRVSVRAEACVVANMFNGEVSFDRIG